MLIFCEFRFCRSNCFYVPDQIPMSTWDEPVCRNIPTGWFIITSQYLMDKNSLYWNISSADDGGLLVCPECIIYANRDVNKNNEDAIWLLNVIAELKSNLNK